MTARVEPYSDAFDELAELDGPAVGEQLSFSTMRRPSPRLPRTLTSVSPGAFHSLSALDQPRQAPLLHPRCEVPVRWTREEWGPFDYSDVP